MKTLTDIFPNASKSTLTANPQLSYGLVANTKTVAAITKRRGNMNKTEREFALILEGMKQRGEIREWKFESVKIRIGEGCWYCPDFVVQYSTGEIVFKEVKGFLRDDARVKFLAAKEQHQWAEWEMWQKTKKEGWKRKL